MNNEITKLLSLAQRLFRAGDIDNAKTLYKQIARLTPDRSEAYLALGTIALKENNLQEATAHFEKALSLDQNQLDAHLALGAIAMEENDYQKSIGYYEKALLLDPKCTAAYNDLALIYYHERPDIDKAFGCIKKSLSIDPEQFWPSMAMAELSVIKGYWYEGYSRHTKNYPFYENYRNATYQAFQALPRWHGEIFSGKRLIIGDHAGFAGFGDIIMLSRYLSQVKERGGHVTLPVRRELLRLFEGLAGVDQLIIYEADEILAEVTPQKFDLHIPLVFLPAIFGISANNIPAKIPYLSSNPSLNDAFKKMTSAGDNLKVGLVWSGNNRILPQRSCNFKALEPLVSIPGITYYSLQVGQASKELSQSGAKLNIVDLTQHLTDFADTAALIHNLDLVIAVDTAVAHLAGAMGKPVWLILPFVPSWFWSIDRSDSPWYPTMRIFRSKAPADWSAAVEEVCLNLKTAVQNKTLIKL